MRKPLRAELYCSVYVLLLLDTAHLLLLLLLLLLLQPHLQGGQGHLLLVLGRKESPAITALALHGVAVA